LSPEEIEVHYEVVREKTAKFCNDLDAHEVKLENVYQWSLNFLEANMDGEFKAAVRSIMLAHLELNKALLELERKMIRKTHDSATMLEEEEIRIKNTFDGFE